MVKKGETKHTALYRKHRSKSLDEVVGQSHITDILSRSLEQGKIAHAYLFTGPRGVGKTSVARILAHEINNLPYDEATFHPDIIEIDAASNRRIDDIRDLREKVNIAPTSAKYKVYIIDEVHMLTGESFNAFLKTLEEPPAHVVFILATTDAHKLPVTITSRTQRFGFRAITTEDAKKHLSQIAKAEKIAIDDEALELVVDHGDGSFRDSISLLDQLSGLSSDTPISRELVERVLGLAAQTQVEALLLAYQAHDNVKIIEQLSQFDQQGIAATIVANQLISLIQKNIVVQPELIDVLEKLLDVQKSSRPDVKLLTTLLHRTETTHKHAATIAAAPELKPLEIEAVKPRPSEATVRKAAQKIESEQPTAVVTAEKKVKKDTTPKESIPFDWDGYVAYMKEYHVALSSILAKCKSEFDGTTLTIYTGSNFWKKKLDDVKYQPILHEVAVTLGMGGLTIETVPTTAPLKDSQAAAIAEIMGGGEEVSLPS